MILSNLVLLSLLISGVLSDQIVSWNLDNVDVPFPDGGYVQEEVYKSIVDDGMGRSFGGVLWVESDVMAPGMKVVTDGDGNAADSSCIMTSGENPQDSSEKQCNDPFQTSKRVKVFTSDTTGPVDLVFNVSDAMVTDNTYRFFLKYENLSANRIQSFTLNLGTGVGDGFDPSAANDGLSFAKRDGTVISPSLEYQDIDLAGLFAFGLFGDADTNERQTFDGYYDPDNRGTFAMTVMNEDEILAEPVSDNIASLYGGSMQTWIQKDIAPEGYFYDIDDDSDTDPVLVADFDGSGQGWQNYRLCTDAITLDLLAKGFLLNSECRRNDAKGPVPISPGTILLWESNPGLFSVDNIEDFGNVNVNTHIKVEGFGGDKFTIRLTPEEDPNPPIPEAPWLEEGEPPVESNLEIVGLSVTPKRLKVGKTARIKVSVGNEGDVRDGGTLAVVLILNQESPSQPLGSQIVTVPADKVKNYFFEWQIDAAGAVGVEATLNNDPVTTKSIVVTVD